MSIIYNSILRLVVISVLIAFAMCANAQGVVPDNFDLSTLTAKAESGDPTAQYKLGEAYRNGNGVAKDRLKAFEWYKKAALQGDAQSQLAVGLCYLSGFDGTAKDDKEGVKWLQMAAEQKNVDAAKKLGNIYEGASGIPANDLLSMKWYKEAAELGDAESQFMVGRYYLEGTGVAENPTEGAKWVLKAANQENLDAMLKMQELYSKGIGVKKNVKLAKMWKKKLEDTNDILEKAE